MKSENIRAVRRIDNEPLERIRRVGARSPGPCGQEQDFEKKKRKDGSPSAGDNLHFARGGSPSCGEGVDRGGLTGTAVISESGKIGLMVAVGMGVEFGFSRAVGDESGVHPVENIKQAKSIKKERQRWTKCFILALTFYNEGIASRLIASKSEQGAAFFFSFLLKIELAVKKRKRNCETHGGEI